MLYLYVPFNDPELITGANNYIGENEVNPRPAAAGPKVRIHGTNGASLNDLGSKDTLHILAHGRESRGNQIAGMVDGYLWGKRMVTMTAQELAAALRADGLALSAGDVRLMVCWGGYVGGSKVWGDDGTLKRTATEAPFAGQLCSALKALGYYRMVVTGYRGSVLFSTNHTKLNTVLVRDESNNLMDNHSQALNAPLTLAKHTHALTLDTASRTVWY
jgi:hypothetical protein